MTFAAFRTLVFAKGWTIEQLRCSTMPPSEEMLAVMDRIGLSMWARFVNRIQREADANLTRMAFGGDYR